MTGLAEGSGEARVTLPREVGDMLRIMDVIVFPSGLAQQGRKRKISLYDISLSVRDVCETHRQPHPAGQR